LLFLATDIIPLGHALALHSKSCSHNHSILHRHKIFREYFANALIGADMIPTLMRFARIQNGW